MTETAIPRRTLHDELVDRLRRQIVEGELAPGDKINERELCDTYQVSRTPLREALKVLARERLVVLTPHRGAQVSMLTVEDMEEAFPVIGALEALAGELACQNASDAEIARIREFHDRMAVAHRERDRTRYFRLNQKIHEALAQAACNPTLTTMRSMLDGRISRARYYANISAPRWDQAMAEHREILEALVDRDGERLGAVLKRHLENKLETLKSVLEHQEEMEE